MHPLNDVAQIDENDSIVETLLVSLDTLVKYVTTQQELKILIAILD